MSRSLKVYGWTGYRSECKPNANGNRQTREICAASSWAEVARIAGDEHKPHRDFGSVTDGKAECALALANPRVVFWRPIDDYDSKAWKRASPGPSAS